MRNSIVPTSISFLNYKNPTLFKIIMGLAIALSIYSGAYITTVGFSLVYIFRYFNFQTEMHPHYVGAAVGFTGLMLHTDVVWPALLGAILAIILHIFKNKNYIFWFEMIAGIPYIYYLLTI